MTGKLTTTENFLFDALEGDKKKTSPTRYQPSIKHYTSSQLSTQCFSTSTTKCLTGEIQDHFCCIMSLSKLVSTLKLAYIGKRTGTAVKEEQHAHKHASKTVTSKHSSKKVTSKEAVDPSNVALMVDVDEVEAMNHTTMFDVPEYLATRRDSHLQVTLRSRCCSSLTVETATLEHETGHAIKLNILSQHNMRRVTIAKLQIPATTPVGAFTLTVCGKYTHSLQSFQAVLRDPKEVIVLFNPWSRNDGVYMEDEKCREEYVTNSKGRLYVGNLKGFPWNLAISRPDCLRACIMLLEERSVLPLVERKCPIQVAREMSALINVQDDLGVLEGNWSGDYSDGQPPTFWRGSGAILQQYYETGGDAVCYGQCWVFSGVLLTILRILGIPSRSVTAFNSGHDSNCSRSIDYYCNEDGETIDYLSSGNESVWNFHVWNEAWMTRPDLPQGFEGWQALDATPQEESEQGGGFRLGPAPVKAIKNGNTVPYDTNFVISEVNADIKRFIVSDDGIPRLYHTDETHVGKTISTKAIGNNDREDITDQYKYPEGSRQERRALYHGLEELQTALQEVDFEVPEINYNLGEKDVVFAVQIKNKSLDKHTHHINGRITCTAVSYTGKKLRDVGAQRIDNRPARKGKVEIINMFVDSTIFSEFPGSKVHLLFKTILTVRGTKQVFSNDAHITPIPPPMDITCSEVVTIGKEAKVSVKFINPLAHTIDNVRLTIESDELLEVDVFQTIGSVASKAELNYTLNIIGQKVGTHSLVVALDCDKIEMVTGEMEVEVVAATEEQEEAPCDIEEEKIKICNVQTNIQANCAAHFTNLYEVSDLILRRGQPFSLTLVTTRPLPAYTAISCSVVFQLVSTKPSVHFSFEVNTTLSLNGNTISLICKAPPDSPIGVYMLILTVSEGNKMIVIDEKIPLVLLFNPWCPEDICFYPERTHLEEYVLNTSGKIWTGTYKDYIARPWHFDQFHKDSLEVVLTLLEQIPLKERSNPIQVCRHLSALVNMEGIGVLCGSWNGELSQGTSPLDWTSSVEILSQFKDTKMPVKYGQCWVFSGVLTTLLRAVGMACRPVTNFVSAHDVDMNRSVDMFYNENGEDITSTDTIWNFHVWNEVWLARPDLSRGFSGWQVVDATPQNRGDAKGRGSIRQLGPAPRHAIKLGQKMDYDVEYIISEVNADIRYYTIHCDRSTRLSWVNTNSVGKCISTKAIGCSEREDLTDQYKFPEGSAEERAALLSGETESEKKIDVAIEMVQGVTIGQDFNVKVLVSNKANTATTLKVHIHGSAVLYTGAPGQIVKSSEHTLAFNKWEQKTVIMKVFCPDYLRVLESGNFMSFVAMVHDPSLKIAIIKTDVVRLKTPEIVLTLPDEGLQMHRPCSITASFKNPLAKRLTDCRFSVMSGGYVHSDCAIIQSVIAPCGTFMTTFKVTPVKPGRFTLVVQFHSDQLADVTGDQDVTVADV